MIFSINGIGLRFCAIQKQATPNTFIATVWFTFLFLPIAPIKRVQLLLLSAQGSRLQYQPIKKLPLAWQAIAKTYLYGWLIFPLMIFWPFFVTAFFGITSSFFGRASLLSSFGPVLETASAVSAVGSIIWLAVCVWKLKTWDMMRWHA